MQRPSSRTRPHDPKLEPAQHVCFFGFLNFEGYERTHAPGVRIAPSSAIRVCQCSCSRHPLDATTGTWVVQHALSQTTVVSAARFQTSCAGLGFATGIRRQLHCTTPSPSPTFVLSKRFRQLAADPHQPTVGSSFRACNLKQRQHGNQTPIWSCVAAPCRNVNARWTRHAGCFVALVSTFDTLQPLATADGRCGSVSLAQQRDVGHVFAGTGNLRVSHVTETLQYFLVRPRTQNTSANRKNRNTIHSRGYVREVEICTTANMKKRLINKTGSSIG